MHWLACILIDLHPTSASSADIIIDVDTSAEHKHFLGAMVPIGLLFFPLGAFRGRSGQSARLSHLRLRVRF